MCSGCWKEYGEPQIDNRQVRHATKLIAMVYEFSPTGGNLHVQLDDWNIDDEYWEKFIVYPYFADSIGRIATELRCWRFMRNMTVEERASALALYDGFWEEQ